MILSQFGPCFNSSVQQIVSGKYHMASILKSIKNPLDFGVCPAIDMYAEKTYNNLISYPKDR